MRNLLLVELKQDLERVLCETMRESSNEFSVSLQMFRPTQDIIFSLSLELFLLLCTLFLFL